MLVQVVMLRDRGQRLTAEQVRASRALEGYISVRQDVSPRLPVGKWSRVARLTTDPGNITAIAELYEVRLVRWDGRGIVLSGIEEHWRRKERTDYRQAWWVRWLDAAAVARANRPHPIDTEERLEAMAERIAAAWMGRA
jgi:hypothetical protein